MICLALGASRWRIARLSLAEALVMGAAAFVLHLPLSVALMRAAALSRPEALWMLDRVSPDGRVLLAGALGTMLLTAGCALAAMWSGVPRDFTPLRSGEASATPGTHRLRRVLITAEVALACVLVVGAVLLGRSFVALVRRDPGFRPDGALILTLRPPPASGARPAIRGDDPRWETLVRAIEAQPGIVGATRGVSMPPESGIEFGQLEIEGRETTGDQGAATASASYVSAGFFRLAGIRLIEGADFPTGLTTSEQPVIINRSMARRFWPTGGAVGARIRFTVRGSRQQAPPWHRVVGVADDVLAQGLHSDERAIHVYHTMTEFGGTPEYFVRFRGARDAAARQVRAIVHEVTPDVAVEKVSFADDLLLESARADRFYLIVLGVIAVLAGSLAIVGVFGVVASITLQRTREIAVRIALGSTPARIYTTVIGDGMRAVLLGLAIGIAGAGALGHALRALLYGVNADDPIAFAIAVVLIAAAATGACVFPARRAARLEPAAVLRSE